MAGSNSPFGSSSSVSSLLKSADATAAKVQAYNDAVAAFNWDNSLKTVDDFTAYSQYLNTEASKTTDPTAQLNYIKKINTARSGYISNEIQRQTINIVEGNGTNISKYNAMVNLYYQAADAGQYDLAQSLRLQLDNLSVTIQNDNKASYGASSSAAKTSFVNAVNDNIDSMKSDIKNLTSLYTSGTHKDFTDFVKANADQLGVSPNADFFDVVTQYVDAIGQAYTDAMSSGADASQVKTWQKAYNSFIDSSISLPSKDGNINISHAQLLSADQLNRMGEQMYALVPNAQFDPTTGKVEVGSAFVKQNQTGYAYGTDQQGNRLLIPTYGSTKDTFKVDVNGKTVNYADILKQQGYNVTESNGALFVTNTNGQTQDKYLPGTEGAQPVQVFIGQNGQLQFVGGDGQLYNFNIDAENQKYLGIKKETANPIIGTYDKHNTPYLANVDPNSIPGGTIGLIRPGTAFMESGPLGVLHYNPQPAAKLPVAPVQQLQAPVQNIQNTASGNSILSAPASATIKLPTPKKLPTITLNTKPNTQTISTTPTPTKQPTITISSGGYKGPGISF